MTSTNDNVLTVRIDPKLKRRLEVYATVTGGGQRVLVERALTVELDKMLEGCSGELFSDAVKAIETYREIKGK